MSNILDITYLTHKSNSFDTHYGVTGLALAFVLLLIGLIPERAVASPAFVGSRPWGIVDAAKQVDMGLPKDVFINDFATNGKKGDLIFDSGNFIGSHKNLSNIVIVDIFPIEQDASKFIININIFDVLVNEGIIQSWIGRIDAYMPTKLEGRRYPIVMEGKTPTNEPVWLRQDDRGFIGIQTHPRSLAHLKVLSVEGVGIQRGVPLPPINNYSTYSGNQGNNLQRAFPERPSLPKWQVCLLAALLYVVTVWAWYNLRRERYMPIAPLVFIASIILWFYFLSRTLGVSLF